ALASPPSAASDLPSSPLATVLPPSPPIFENANHPPPPSSAMPTRMPTIIKPLPPPIDVSGRAFKAASDSAKLSPPPSVGADVGGRPWISLDHVGAAAGP